jgi:hypothetical protein
MGLHLNPEQAHAADAMTASLTVNEQSGSVHAPGLTTAVIVSGRDSWRTGSKVDSTTAAFG